MKCPIAMLFPPQPGEQPESSEGDAGEAIDNMSKTVAAAQQCAYSGTVHIAFELPGSCRDGR